jgi:tetratricopeptide (TPR) repeat protein
MTQTNRFQNALREGTRLLHAGKTHAALRHLKRAHDLAPDHPNAALNLAGAYILAGRFRQAVPILETLAERTPDNPAVWINLGAAYLGNPILASDEQQRQAIDAFRRALELDAQSPSVHYNIGLIHRDRGEREEAIAMFRMALEVNPDDHDAHRLLKKLHPSAS